MRVGGRGETAGTRAFLGPSRVQAPVDGFLDDRTRSLDVRPTDAIYRFLAVDLGVPVLCWGQIFPAVSDPPFGRPLGHLGLRTLTGLHGLSDPVGISPAIPWCLSATPITPYPTDRWKQVGTVPETLSTRT